MKLPEYALHDPALALAPLFLALPKKERTVSEVSRNHKSNIIRWHAKESLSILEQSVYLAVVAIAGQQKMKLATDNPGKIGNRLIFELNLQSVKNNNNFSVLKSSLGQIAYFSGYKSVGGKNRESVRQALCRLSETMVVEREDDVESRYQLLAWTTNRDADVFIALNPRATAVLQGAPYAYISLEERRALPNDYSKGLHAWLSGTIRKGQQRRYLIDGLQQHVWGNFASGTTTRTRRLKLRNSLLQIDKLSGWECRFDAYGYVDVLRQ